MTGFTVTIDPLTLTAGPSPVQQFLSRVSVSAGRQALYTTLVNTLVSAGIWNLGDALYVFDTDNSAAALQNLISSRFTAVVHGTMTFTAGSGYTGDGSTGYLDSTLNPSSSGGLNYSLNGASMVLGVVSAGASVESIMGAANTGTNDRTYIYNTANGGTYDTFQCALNEAAATFMGGPILQGSETGILGASRTGSGLESSYFNGSVVYAQASDASTSVPTTTVLIGALNDTGGIDLFSSAQMGAAWIGGALTDAQMAILMNAINTYLTADAVNPYPIALSSGAMSSPTSLTVPAFGINSHTTINDDISAPITPAQNLTMMQYLGVTVARVDVVDWAQVEPVTKGAYVWDDSGGGFPFGDPYINGVDGLLTAGLTMDLVLAYSNTLYESSFFTAPTDAPGLSAYSAYAAAVAGRYGATKTTFEIWNEENQSNGAGQYSWAPAANAANYATLFDDAVTAIIGAVPTATIISGAVVLGGGSGYIAPTTFLSAFLSDASQTHLANVAYHAYTAVINAGQSPEIQVEQSIQAIQSTVGGTYGAKLIVNEFGYATPNCNGSETIKAVMNMRALLWMACIGGVAQLTPYDLVQDDGMYGYFDDSFNPLPSGVAYKAIISAFSSAISVVYFTKTYNSSYAQFFAILIEKSATSFVLIAWCSVSSFTFTWAAGANLLSFPAADLFGNPVAVSNDGSGNLAFAVSDLAGPVIVTLTYS